MRPTSHLRTCAVAVAATLLLGVGASVHAAGLLDGLKGAATEQLGGGSSSGSAGGMLSGLGLPSMSGSTAGNAAGVVQYCIKNKYLGGGASGVKDSLLRKAGLGGKEEKDPGYQSGLAGMLSGSDGKSFDMSKIQSSLKEKACDYVLDNAKSLL
jgi:hypothetical protein